MDNKNGIHNVHELIERYTRELMSTYRQQQPLTNEQLDREYPLPDIARDRQVLAAAAPVTPTPPAPPQQPPQPPTPPTALEPPQQPPQQQPSPSAAPEPPQQPPQPPTPPTDPEPPQQPVDLPQEAEPAPYVGNLQIYAYTGSTAEPIEGAQVFVSRDNGEGSLLYASTVTDRSGLTPMIPLPSVDPMLTMSPEAAQSGLPYIAYDIQVSALGFTPIRFENVPIYGGNSVTQPAALLPLIAGDNPDLPRVYRSGGPTNL